jgi:myo-inositol 2-dehydrogenase / D-chiro-inositol 1-dehydrogenase
MIDVALFGAGRIGKIHAGNVVRQPGVRLRHVVDVDDASASALAHQHGAKVATADAVFADPSVAIVVIASSTDTHADLIQRAAGAGKAIFCEKPVDLDLGRARTCAQAVARAGVTCLIGFQRRYDPTFAALKARIDAGEIGDPEMLVVTSRDPGAPPIDYVKRSGGIFKDMLIHDFDILRWILDDEAATLYATGSCLVDPAIEAAGDVDATAVTIRTKKGRLAQINTIRRAAYGYDQRFEVIGSKGMLQAGNHKPTEVIAWNAANVGVDKPEHFFLERYRAAYAAEMAHFVDAIANKRPVRTSIDDGVKALALADAATRSWREKRIVELPA